MIDFACKKFELNSVVKCGLNLSKSDFSVIKFLMEKKGKYNSKELSRKLSLELSTIQRSLKNLTEKKLIIRSQTNLKYGGYVFKYEINDKRIIKKIIREIVHGWVEKVDRGLEKW
jgi:predicted transcriptional regulator